MRFLAVTSITVLLAAPVALAQERGQAERQAAVENDVVTLKRNAELMTRVALDKQIKGAPYSGDVIVSSSQTLADGNHIVHSDTSHVFRDSAGRTRREQSGRMSEVGRGQPIASTQGPIVNIFDPVGGFSYSLDAEHKIAWRTPIGTSQDLLIRTNAASEEAMAKLRAEKESLAAQGRSGGDAVVGAGGADVARIKLENGVAYSVAKAPLEHATIDGLAVDGRKTSETIPAGKIGNELPITITNEEWTSIDLKVLVLTKHND
ncbi:MAG TPA: hypothetical protein VH138_02920, partial [Vicinamibacterales bacterium]|nr:hypothetical protein [Vicinamibacterales bacterium]